MKHCVVLVTSVLGEEHRTSLARQVLSMAERIGFKPPVFRDGHINQVLIFGPLFTGDRQSMVYHDCTWPSPYRESDQRFEIPRDMAALAEYWGLSEPEPEYDETPLTHTMNKEEAAAAQVKFNLSPDQWDNLPLPAQQALAGTEVTVVRKVGGTGRWTPVDGANLDDIDYITVMLTNDPSLVHDDALHCLRAGFWNGERWTMTQGEGEFVPTHFLTLPDPHSEVEVETRGAFEVTGTGGIIEEIQWVMEPPRAAQEPAF